MNILTKIRLINELNEKEIRAGTKPEASWHTQYKDSAWIYAGNLPYQLTEGFGHDIIINIDQSLHTVIHTVGVTVN